jgi:hypothetical protein
MPSREENTIMHTEERVFDFMAAAEETGKQLDEMAERIPVEVKALLAEEWRKSPWLAELPKAATDARAATEEMAAATEFLNRSVRLAGLVVCLASLVIPLAAWGVIAWNVSGLRREAAALESEKQSLAATIAKLKSETGGGAQLLVDDDGICAFVLPPGLKIDSSGQARDGRYYVRYTMPR